MNKPLPIHILRAFLAALTAAIGALDAPAAPPNPLKNTYCNPIDIPYNFWSIRNGQAYREAADPDMVLFKNEYYLFSSHSGGYFWSTDMRDWKFVSPKGIDVVKYAPAVAVVGDAIYFISSEGGRMAKSTDPKSGVWTDVWTGVDPSLVNSVPDPALFRDDDGRVYNYHGLSPNGAISVLEVDPNRNMTSIRPSVNLIRSDTASHGFEVFGDNNLDVTHVGESWFEGSYMRKNNNKYYLTYSAPGTQHRSYGDGCYVGDSPKGPFRFAPHSPVSFRPLGFVTGTGHSSTFKDPANLHWHITTAVVSTIDMFERRLAIFPAYFDRDDWFRVDTYLGDYPQFLPGNGRTAERGNFAGAMLLSYGKQAAASSTVSGFPISNAFDDNIKTWWSAATTNSGEWLRVDLGRVSEVAAIQTNFAEHRATYQGGRGTSFSHKFRIEGALDTAGPWILLVDKSRNTKDVPHDYSVLDSVTRVRHVRVTNAGPMPGGGTFAIRDLRVFGNGLCDAPQGVNAFTVSRRAPDTRLAVVSWNPVADAEGYIIRFGIAPDKLYNSYQVMGGDSRTYDIRSLNVGVKYHFTIETYSGCGITRGALVKADDNSTSIPGDGGIGFRRERAGMGIPAVGNRFFRPHEYLGRRIAIPNGK